MPRGLGGVNGAGSAAAGPDTGGGWRRALLKGAQCQPVLAVVPGLFRNHSFDGNCRRGVARRQAPVGSDLGLQGGQAGGEVAIVKVRSANGHVVGGRGKAAYSLAIDGIVLRVVVIASCGSVVACRYQHGNALCGCLLPQVVQECVGAAQIRLAVAKTEADDRRDVAVDRSFGREKKTAFKCCVGTDDEIDSGPRGYRSRPLHIKVSFHRRAILAIRIIDAIHTGIISVDDHLWRIDWKAKETAELIDKVDVDVRFVDDGDRLARTLCSRGIERIEIVLDGVIGRREDKAEAR